MNVSLEKDGKLVPTAIPVIYLPKKLLEQSDGFQHGAITELGGGSSCKIATVVGGALIVKDGSYSLGDVLNAGTLKKVGEGVTQVNTTDYIHGSRVHVDATSSDIKSSRLTYAYLISEEGKLILNSQKQRLSGIGFEGEIYLNSNTTIDISPQEMINAFSASGGWGYVNWASLKNILNNLKGSLTINSDGKTVVLGLDAQGEATILRAFSKESVHMAAAVDKEFFDSLSISKKKGVFKSKVRIDKHTSFTNEFQGNNFGSNGMPIQLFSVRSDGKVEIVAINLHAFKYEFISEEQVIIYPALALNYQIDFASESKKGFLGFKNGGIVIVESKERLLAQGYTVIKRSELHNYGIAEESFLKGKKGVDAPGASFSNHNNKGTTKFTSEQGSVNLGGNQELKSYSYEQVRKSAASYGQTLSPREVSAHAKWQEQEISKLRTVSSEIPTNLNNGNFVIQAKNGEFIFKGTGIYVNLDVDAKDIKIESKRTIIEEATKEMTKQFMVKFGFYNNFANTYDQFQAASETEEDISKGFAYAGAIYSLAKAILNPISMDLKFQTSWQQGKLIFKEANLTPSTLRSTGNTTFNGFKVSINGLMGEGINWTINAHEFLMQHAFSSFEKKMEVKGVNGEVSFIDSQTIGGGINFSQLKQSGMAPNELFLILSGTFELNAKTAHIEGHIEASKVILKLDKLLLKSVYRVMKSEGFSGKLSAKIGYNPNNFTPPSFEFGAEVRRGDHQWIDQMASIVGTESVSAVIKEMLHIQGGLIAQAKRGENGELIDGGNLEIKAFEILAESLYSYIHRKDIGGSVGVDFGLPKIIDRISFLFGMTDKEKETFATIGRGNIQAFIRNVLNRDINNLQSERGFEIDPITGFYQSGYFDTVSAAMCKVQGTFDRYFNNDAGNVKEPEISIWDVIDYDVSEDELEDAALRDILKETKAQQSTKSLQQIREDIACIDVHRVLSGNPEMQEVSVKLYQHMVKNGMDENEALAILGNSLIQIHENPYAVAQNAAFPFALGAVEACATNPACVNLVALTLTGAFAAGKIMVEGFDIAEDIETTLWTPETKLDIKDEGFVPVDIDATLPGFEPSNLKFKLPGFEIWEGDTLNILFKDDNSKITDYEIWKKSIEFNGNKVYQRDDLIDPKLVDHKKGMTNLELMKDGKAPKGPDGKPINLHHLIQTPDGSIAEVTESFHKKYTKIIHINPPTVESAIDRKNFDKWRSQYWKERAKDFEEKR